MAFHISKRTRGVSYAVTLCLSIPVVLAAIYYPRNSDHVLPISYPSAEDNRAAYRGAWSKVAKNETAPLPDDPQTKEIRNFVERYKLQDKRVLEVGAGRGKNQDVVADYTGLDIAEGSKPHFHKPFVLASATSMPFPDSDFDVIWTVDVLEHVPKPEAALSEMRRVLRNGGLLYLYPAWYCRSWHADGCGVRPYGDFDMKGKLIKASIPLRDSVAFRSLYTIPIRILRLSARTLSGKPTSFRYNAITPNYTHHWESDSDAVNSMDPYEAILWFKSRGDSILNYDSSLSQFFVRTGVLIIRVQK